MEHDNSVIVNTNYFARNKTRRGRPRKYETPEEFEIEALGYFDECRKVNEPYTITGLALYMGFSGRQEFYNYAKYEGFEEVVSQARAAVEHSYEKQLRGNKPTGAIFALKNMEWRDERSVNVESPNGSMSPKPGMTIDTSKLSTEQLAALYGSIKVDSDK